MWTATFSWRPQRCWHPTWRTARWSSQSWLRCQRSFSHLFRNISQGGCCYDPDHAPNRGDPSFRRTIISCEERLWKAFRDKLIANSVRNFKVFRWQGRRQQTLHSWALWTSYGTSTQSTSCILDAPSCSRLWRPWHRLAGVQWRESEKSQDQSSCEVARMVAAQNYWWKPIQQSPWSMVERR